MKKYLKLGSGLITNTIVMSSIPNISGNAMEDTVKGDYMKGLGNVSSKLPAMGNIIGTGMVLKQVKKLKKIKL